MTPLVSVLLTIITIELALVTIRPIPFSIEANMYFEPDPFTYKGGHARAIPLEGETGSEKVALVISEPKFHSGECLRNRLRRSETAPSEGENGPLERFDPAGACRR